MWRLEVSAVVRHIYMSLGFKRLKISRNSPKVAQGVPGRLRPRIFLTFRHYKGGRYCAGGKIEKNEMGGACGAYGGGVHRVLVGKLERKRPLGRPRRR